MIVLKFRNPTCVFQPGSSSSPSAATNEPWPLSANDLAVDDPDERVVRRRRSGASARARSRSRAPSGRIALSPPVGTVKSESSLSIVEQLRALDDRVALALAAIVRVVDLTSPSASGSSPSFVPTYALAGRLVDEQQHEVAVLRRAPASSGTSCRSPAGASELPLDPVIASDFERMWPVE